MEIFLPWNWPPQLIALGLGIMLVVALAGYVTTAAAHIAKPSQRDKALEQARAYARSCFDHYEPDADKDKVARRRYNKAKADLRVLENPGALAFQWYQLKNVGWLFGVRHWVFWGIAIVGAYVACVGELLLPPLL